MPKPDAPETCAPPRPRATRDRVAASLDIGTNTVRLLVVKIAADGHIRRVFDDGRMTRLGDALTPDGDLMGPAAEATLAAVAAYAQRAKELSADTLVPYATAGVRRAARPEAFLRRAESLVGTPIRLISGDEEARLSYLGAGFSRARDRRPIVVADVGGGSTELSWGIGAEYRGGTSVPIGSRVLATRYGTSSPERILQAATLREALGTVCRALGPLCAGTNGLRCKVLVGTGGTITALIAIQLGLKEYDPDRVHGSRMSRAELGRLAWRLALATLEERRAMCHLEPERAEVIVHGAAVFWGLMDLLGVRAVEADVNGVRLGVILNAVGITGNRMESS